MKKVDVRMFVTEAFDYLNKLKECSINRSVNRYLLEYIAYGFAQYGDAASFIDNIDDWVRMLVKIYPELGFDHETHQVRAVIDLVDQLVVIDDVLRSELEYPIQILEKYGLLIEYQTKNTGKVSTTISRFFEFVEDKYPVIADRYKGLGSSDAVVSKEVIMDPKTRRIMRVTMHDVDTMRVMDMLIGSGKENTRNRKDMLMNFKFTMDMIDN